MTRLSNWIEKRLPYRLFFRKQFLEYRVPYNLNIFYLFGVLLLLVLGMQVVSGVWLMFFYTPAATLAFDSIQSIMRDVNWGWLFRYVHTTGASFLFLLLYLHLFRGLLYFSYQKPRELVWILGMGLFVLFVMEASLGYALPWGQLSYWSAQVLTSFLSAIPYVGERLVLWLRGDYVVSDVTLHRFYVLHTIMIPILVFFILKMHLRTMKHTGSTNPTRHVLPENAYIPFHPFYTIKDSFACAFFLIIFFSIVCFFPKMWGYFIEPMNSIPANPMVTPEEIVPLWYLAPFYAILRAVPSKLGGLLLLCSSLGIWFFLPWIRLKQSRFYFIKLTLLIFSFVGLGVLGLIPLTPFRLWLARALIVAYFSFFWARK
jgi:ubiquinol-cytochrome c reductase cytochrome b subunit